MSSPSPASSESAACPTCHAALVLGANGLAGIWSCPGGHGVAVTVTAAYGSVDGAEIQKLWQASEKAAAGTRACPMCGAAMVEVPDGAVSVDVCRADELFWLDAGELDQLPKAAPAAPPTPEQERDLQAIRQTFDAGLDAALRQEMSSPLDRLVDRISGRHPAFTPVLASSAAGQTTTPPPDPGQPSHDVA